MVAGKQREPLEENDVELGPEGDEKAKAELAEAKADPKKKPSPIPPKAENIPQPLADSPKWTLWDYTWKEEAQKWDKPPKDPNTGRAGSSTNPAKWAPLDIAIAARERYGYSGIGYCLEYDFTSLDLDHVLGENGVLMDEYRWIVDEADTYTEVSPSGRGLRLFFKGPKKCKANPSKRHQKDGTIVELYDHGHYMTVTGNLYHDETGVVHTEIREASGVVQSVYDKYLAASKPAPGNASRKGSVKSGGTALVEGHGPISDEEVVNAMLSGRRAKEVANLMAGETSGFGDGNSDADWVLLKFLAYYTGGDADQMDRIFRTSKLYEKRPDNWDRIATGDERTYGELTIQNAIEACEGRFYIPTQIRKGVSPSSATTKARTLYPWFVDEQGCLWRDTVDGEFKVTVTPPFIVADLEDVDGDGEEVRALVSITVNGREKLCGYDRPDILSNRRIVDTLSRLNAHITSDNSSQVVAYLTATDGEFSNSRPKVRSCRHLGWVEHDVGTFLPYDDDAFLDPPDDMRRRVSPFKEPRGTLEEWVNAMYPHRSRSVAFRAVLAASFASVLVPVIRVQQFTVYIWCESGFGKTATARAGGSIWGDTRQNIWGAYFRAFRDTENSSEHYATFLNSLPLFLDELQSKKARGGLKEKRQEVSDLLYTLSLGTEKDTLSQSRTSNGSGAWNLITVATGEMPILDETTMQGAVNRTLEINAEPLANGDEALEMHAFVSDHYGTAGREFVKALQEAGGDKIREEWAKFRPRVVESVSGNPQAGNIAVLAFADALADAIVFSGRKRRFEAVVKGEKGALAFARNLAAMTATREQRDNGRHAIEFVAEWLNQYEGRFVKDGDEYPSIDRYGFREGGYWYVIPKVFNEALRAANHDPTKTLKRMRDEEVIECDANRLKVSKRPRNGGETGWYVCIDGDALTEFISMDGRP